MDIYFRKFRSE